jgi:hypothetical protein
MKYGQEFLDRLRSNKTKDPNKVILDQTKGTLTGSAIGLTIGLFIGYSRNYNLLMSAFLGALVGGVITRISLPKDK